jgi:predicted GNAT superfamily acetyltransferase
MIEIRNCKGQDELEACVQLQVETWGYDPSDVIPRKAFLVWQKVGGQVIGAFDSDRTGTADATKFQPGNLEAEAPETKIGSPGALVGFVLSLPGIKIGQGEPSPYLHSHMMAVRDGYRNRGLGYQLKLAQRNEALARGIRHMEWTFDPLEIKNAFLNIHKLGAVVRRYEVDFYGVSSSRLQGGLPTDRLVAEWHLDSQHVQNVVHGLTAPLPVIEERILVPASIYEWKATQIDRERALAVQLENRHKFQQAFAQGLAVLGFVRDSEGNGIFELGNPSQLNLH